MNSAELLAVSQIVPENMFQQKLAFLKSILVRIGLNLPIENIMTCVDPSDMNIARSRHMTDY